MSEEDFVKEIQELKDKMMVVANRHSNVTKFEINIDYSWENRNTIVDWKVDGEDNSLHKHTDDIKADKGVKQ